MTKKLLVYNMPEEILKEIESLKPDYDFEILIARDEDLGQKVGYLIGEKDKGIENPKTYEKVDINFLMIHNFSDKELDRFLKDLKEKELFLPNKCISTEMNKTWHLHKLLSENKEESEIMPILHKLYQVRNMAINLIKEGVENEELEKGVTDINEMLEAGDLKKEEIINKYNEMAKIVNSHMAWKGRLYYKIKKFHKKLEMDNTPDLLQSQVFNLILELKY